VVLYKGVAFPVAFVIFIDTLTKLLEAHNIIPKIFADDVNKVYVCA